MPIKIFYNKTDSPVLLRRIANSVQHKEVLNFEYIEIDPAQFKKKGAEKSLPIQKGDVVCMVGTDVINVITGSVRGRNAALKKDDIWYLTINNPILLHQKEYATATANQFIKAITILENDNYDYPKVTHYVLNTYAELVEVIDEALKSYYFAFDFETNNTLLVHDPNFKATCLGICFNPNWVWVVPQHLLYDEAAVKELSRLFSSKVVKIAHNAKFDLQILRKLGINYKPRVACTMLQSFIIDENYASGLKEQIDRYLPEFSGYDYGVVFSDEVNDDLYKYLAIDTHCALLLYCIHIQTIVQDDYFYPLYRNLYIPAMEVLVKMEYNGAYVDTDFLQQKIERIEQIINTRNIEFQNTPEVKRFIILKNEQLVKEQIDALNEKIDVRSKKYDAAKDKFIANWSNQITNLRVGETVLFTEVNVGSPKELSELLYDEIGFNLPAPLRWSGKYKKGKKEMLPSTSTDKAAINEIEHPIGHHIRVIRSFKQMLSTFYQSIAEKAIEGKIYASFKQNGTITGRMSSSSPNLQNLPTRINIQDDELIDVVKGVKKAFIAPQGCSVIAADLSQAELRVIAHYSKDTNMIEAYKNNIDVHAITGQRIAHIDTLEEFMQSPDFKKFRTIAKSANFGLVYNISDEGYIDYIKTMTNEQIDADTAQLHRQSVFGAYPNLSTWHDNMETQVKDNGYVRTWQGLKRRLPEIWSNDKRDVSTAIRLAINNPIQGTIGLYALWLMVWLEHRLPELQLFTSVHDSIVGYVENDSIEYVAQALKDTPTNLPNTNYFNIEELAVPLKIDVEYGTDYGTLTEI